MSVKINSFDLDGVIYIPGYSGVYPGPDDIIITGRSIDEEAETREMLAARGIKNQVYFNPIPFEKKTRVSSGEHKVRTLNRIRELGVEIGIHFEDDRIQAEIIRQNIKDIEVVLLDHALTEKENRRHDDWQKHV